MASYNAPLNKNATYNNSDFNFQNNLTSSQQLSKNYVQYPITQGALSVKGNLTVNGTATINNSLVLTKPTTAPTTWTAPIAGQIGFTINGLNTTAYTPLTGIWTNMSSVALPIGVWYIQYTVFITTLPTVGSITAGISYNTTSVQIGPENVSAGTTIPYASGSCILSIVSPTTIYLNTFGSFTSGTYAINSGSYSYSAVRIA